MLYLFPFIKSVSNSEFLKFSLQVDFITFRYWPLVFSSSLEARLKHAQVGVGTFIRITSA